MKSNLHHSPYWSSWRKWAIILLKQKNPSNRSDKMKRVALFPTVIALTVLLCSPLCLVQAHGSKLQGGLICYCCAEKGTSCTCTKVSCPQCSTHTESLDYDWSPDLILPSVEMTIHFYPAVNDSELFPSLRTGYSQVPEKPPNIL